MKYLSVVIPAYNEAHRIGPTLQDISNFLCLIEDESEIIIVNDGSTDNTEQLVRRFMSGLDDMRRFKTQVILINEKQNRGKGAALRKGMLEANAKYVVFTDADNSTHIREFNKLIEYVKTTYDIAIGSRSLPGSNIIKKQSWVRQTMGKIFNRIVKLSTLEGFIDTQCGFKLFRRDAARTIFSETRINGFACDVEILYIAKKKSYKIIEVPVTWENHPESRVRLFSSSYRMLRDVLKIRKIHTK